MKIYIVRHAKSKRNSGKEDDADSELHEDGKEQAKRLGRYFHRVKLDAVYCSPLKRAVATLDAIKPYLKKTKIIISNDIVEHRMGVYEENGKDDWGGYAKDAITSGKGFLDFKPEKGDSMRETFSRMGKFYKKLLKKYPKDNVLVVGHGIALLYLILNILGLDPKEGAYYQLSNASISTIDIDKKGKVKHYHINDYNHLIAEAIEMKKRVK